MKSRSSQNPVALITGGSSGLGRAIAIEFSKNGYHCLLVGRNQKNLNETMQLLSTEGEALCFDLENLQGLESFFSKKLETYSSQLKVIINNAGFFERASIPDCELALWQKTFSINLISAALLTQISWSYFKNNGGGSILNISSTLGLRPSANVGIYSASKAAMINWTQTLALEGGPLQIRANCICPGLVDTPIHSFHFLPPAEKVKTMDSMKHLQPLGRIGRPEDVAPLAYFLCSEQSPWTTGAVISVDGGINLT